MKKKWFVIFLLYFFFTPAHSQLNVNYWLNKSVDKINKKDYNGAIEDLNLLIQFTTHNNDAYYFRGICKLYLSDYRGSIEDFNTAINTQPNFSYNYFLYFLYRGNAKEHIGDTGGAFDDYNESINISPNTQDAYAYRGILYLNTKRYDEAINDFNQVIWLNKSNSSAYMFRAIAKQFKSQHEEAMEDFTKALKIDPLNVEAYVRRGINLCEMKKYADALADFDKAIKIDGKNSFAYFNRAIANVDLKNYTLAMKDYDKVIELDPENALTYFNRANLKANVGDLAGAVRDYTKVSSINPNNVFTYFNRGIAWYRLNKFNKAIEDYTTAIGLNPTFALAFYNRGIAKQNLKDYPGATHDFAMATNLNASLKLLTKSGKIDSAALAKLTTLQADFENGNMGNVKSRDLDIEPFANFTVSLAPADSTVYLKKKLILKSLDDLNAQMNGKDRFIIQNTDNLLMTDSLATKLLPTLESLPLLPENLIPVFERAILKFDMQNYSGALNDYNKLLQLRKNEALPYFNRANTRYELTASEVLRTSFSGPIVYLGNNKLQAQTTQKPAVKNYDDVIEDYKTCLLYDPSFYYAYFNIGNIKIETHDFNSAVGNYSKAISIEPKFAEAYYNRGLTFIYLKRQEEGCRDLSKAGELGIEKAYVVIKKYCK